ncbi:hypothetical protein KY336_03330 [Candidatus Woesearchaeota archaeon]|nr:hypothetical protein [Candidatus Woesearchaeota archaeon]
MPTGTVEEMRIHKDGVARLRVRSGGKLIYLEVPMKLDFKVGDKVQFSQQKGTSAFRDISRVPKGYKAKK